MKIIVTGALGHIGSRLIRHFAVEFPNSMIIMIDNMLTQRYCSLFNLPNTVNYQFLQNSVMDVDWDSIMEDVDVVIHLSALTDAAGTVDRPEQIYQNNLESTKFVTRRCFEYEVPILFPSSTSVYGSQSSLVDEDCSELKPQSPYADSKIKEENYLNKFFHLGLQGAVCRLGTIYGVSPGMRFHTAVNKFCWQAVLGQSISVWETALYQKRPYLCLDDACRAISWIIKHKHYGGNVFNVVSHNNTVHEVVEAIKVYYPSLTIEMVQHKIMNQLSYEVSSKRFCETGFSFKGNISKGIKETIELLNNVRTVEFVSIV